MKKQTPGLEQKENETFLVTADTGLEKKGKGYVCLKGKKRRFKKAAAAAVLFPNGGGPAVARRRYQCCCGLHK